MKLDKGAPFIGDATRSGPQKERGVTRKLVGFRLEGRGIPGTAIRCGYDGPPGGRGPERRP